MSEPQQRISASQEAHFKKNADFVRAKLKVSRFYYIFASI